MLNRDKFLVCSLKEFGTRNSTPTSISNYERISVLRALLYDFHKQKRHQVTWFLLAVKILSSSFTSDVIACKILGLKLTVKIKQVRVALKPSGKFFPTNWPSDLQAQSWRSGYICISLWDDLQPMLVWKGNLSRANHYPTIMPMMLCWGEYIKGMLHLIKFKTSDFSRTLYQANTQVFTSLSSSS